jgi:hypothetical protein
LLRACDTGGRLYRPTQERPRMTIQLLPSINPIF